MANKRQRITWPSGFWSNWRPLVQMWSCWPKPWANCRILSPYTLLSIGPSSWANHRIRFLNSHERYSSEHSDQYPPRRQRHNFLRWLFPSASFQRVLNRLVAKAPKRKTQNAAQGIYQEDNKHDARQQKTTFSTPLLLPPEPENDTYNSYPKHTPSHTKQKISFPISKAQPSIKHTQQFRPSPWKKSALRPIDENLSWDRGCSEVVVNK